MPEFERVFLIVLDSLGVGALPDASDYGDAGSNTLASLQGSSRLRIPTLQALGLYNIEGVAGEKRTAPRGCFGRMAEQSRGKDTTIGHWELAGIISAHPLPTYPDGFPPDVIRALERETGRSILCNLPYSGTQVIADYGEEHLRTGALIVYTSADSVLQIAAHEEHVPVDELYQICKSARRVMQGEHGVGRIIARPFTGVSGAFRRTSNRHDFSLAPPGPTMLDLLRAAGLDVIGVGKISDIFAGAGLSESTGVNRDNADGMEKTLALAGRDFRGLCFVNLVDFDMLYGHRNDVDGYASALSEFDAWLADFLPLLRPGDALLITADHGCDPSFPGTDHTREYVPVLVAGPRIRQGVNLGTRSSFSDLSATVQAMLGLRPATAGNSFLTVVLD